MATRFRRSARIEVRFSAYEVRMSHWILEPPTRAPRQPQTAIDVKLSCEVE